METSVKAAKMPVTPQPDVASSSSSPSPPSSPPSSSDVVDPMQEFSRRLEDIVSAHGAAARGVLDTQRQSAAEAEQTRAATAADVTVTMETDVSLTMQSLNNLSSPQEKLKSLARKFAEMAALRRSDEKKLCVLQEETQQLQAERRSSVAARGQLEDLCRDMQAHYNTLREETLHRCREDEEKRSEITSHFQKMLTEIQAQIEQHSSRNDKLCQENGNLSDKLEGLMSQCELREESLEKLSRHRELQHKLTEAKLEEANAQLVQAHEKHHREKEYLLREAIDKTKKCFAMKEQELSMKKKLTLYAQKFDEFQATLAKSNEIYVRFKKEMDNMSDKMKDMEKESNLWKKRFENCNKALTDMIEERKEKGKDYDLFVLKIQKLEKLCRVLQEERKVLYEKIKEVRQTNSALPAKLFGSSHPGDAPDSEAEPPALTPGEIQELQEDDPVLTEDMARLREQQTRLQEFAASLLDAPAVGDKDASAEIDLEEDLMASVFVHFKTKTQVKREPVSVPEPAPDVSSEAADADLPPQDEKPDASTPGRVDVQPDEEIQQPRPPAEREAAPRAERVDADPATGARPAPEAAEERMFQKPREVQPSVPEDDEKLPQPPAGPAQVHEEAAAAAAAAASSEATAPSEHTAAKTQAPKKKKKRASKNSS